MRRSLHFALGDSAWPPSTFYDDEPLLDKLHPLLALENVLSMSHIGYVSREEWEIKFGRHFRPDQRLCYWFSDQRRQPLQYLIAPEQNGEGCVVTSTIGRSCACLW